VALVTGNVSFTWLDGKPGARPLTERQAECLLRMREYFVTHGYPPTIREVGELLSVVGTNAANDHVRALHRKGYVRCHQGGRIRNRSISLVEPKGSVIG